MMNLVGSETRDRGLQLMKVVEFLLYIIYISQISILPKVVGIDF